MPRYKTTVRAFVAGTLLGEDVEFSSDDVPGRTWRPIDKDAKAAVRAREDADRKAAADAAVGVEDPRVAGLEAALSEANDRINELQAEVEALTAPAADAK